MKDIETGKQVVNEFFDNLQNLPEIDKTTALIIKTLYENDKLTLKNMENALRKAREEAVSDKD
jgi:hypothetical protein